MMRKLLMLLVLSSTSLGATYYVDPNASGNDDGSDWTNAWETLAQAGDNATAGDIVYAMEGTYTVEDSGTLLTLTNSGTIDAPITFIGDDGAGNPGYVTLDAGSSLAACLSVTNFSVFEHFRMWGSTGAPVIPSSADSVTLYDCIVEDCGDGVRLDNGCRIILCQITDNTGSAGLRVDTLAQIVGCLIGNNTGPELYMLDNWSVAKCVLYDDEAADLMYWANQAGGKFCIDTTFFGQDKSNLGVGIGSDLVTSSYCPTFVNCQFVALGQVADLTYDLSGQTTAFINCGFYDNTSVGATIDTGVNPITSALTIVGAGDYSPGPGSAAIAAGIDAGAVAGGTSYADLGGVQVAATSNDANDVDLTSEAIAAVAAAVWAHANAPTIAAGVVQANTVQIEGTDATDVLNALDPVASYADANGLIEVSVVDVSGAAPVPTLADMFTYDTGTDYSGAVAGSVVKEIADNAAGGDGSGLTAIPWNSAWDAEVQSEAVDALTAYGASTFDPDADALTFSDEEVASIAASIAASLGETDVGQSGMTNDEVILYIMQQVQSLWKVGN